MTPSSSSEPAASSSALTLPSGALFRSYRDARVLWVLGSRIRFLIDAAETGGRFSLTEVYTPAFDPGPPPHMHSDAEEMFHILEGAIRVMIAGQSIVARPGDTLIVPRNTLHTFSNPFLTACRCLVQLTPAGFEGLFSDLGVPPVSSTDLLTPPKVAPPSPEQLRAAAIKHHMRVPGLTE